MILSAVYIFIIYILLNTHHHIVKLTIRTFDLTRIVILIAVCIFIIYILLNNYTSSYS